MELRAKILSLFPREGEIPPSLRRELPLDQEKFLAGGRLEAWDGPRLEIFSPIWIRTKGGLARMRLGSCPWHDRETMERILEGHVAAFNEGRGAWPSMELGERVRLTRTLLGAIRVLRGRIAQLIMWEVAKPLEDAHREVDLALKLGGRLLGAAGGGGAPGQGRARGYGTIRKGPEALSAGIGLCRGSLEAPFMGVILPMIHALLSGNTALIAPRAYGFMIWEPLLEVLQGIFPPGVVSLVWGTEEDLDAALSRSGLTEDPLSSSKGGRTHHHGTALKNPFVVLPGAEPHYVTESCLKGALAFNGQGAGATRILFVHEGLLEPFFQDLLKALGRIRFGMPWEKGVFLTPLADPGAPDCLHDLVSDALAHGAQVMNQAGGMLNRSFFYPAVLCPVTPSMKVYKEIQPGPIVPVVPYKDPTLPLRYVAGFV